MISIEVMRQRRILGFGLICAFLSAPGQTFFIAAFTADMAQSVGVSAGDLGLLYMAGTIGAALLLPLAGSWIDRIDLKPYALLVVLGLAAACAVTASATTPAALLIGLLLLRLTGQGLMSHVAVTSTARFFTALRGRALSIVALGFPLAEAVTPATGLALIALVGWREAYLIVAAALVLIAAPALWALLAGRRDFTAPPEVPAGGSRKGLLRTAARILFTSRYFWFVLPLVVFLPFAAKGLIFHIQPLALQNGWPVVLVGPGFLGFALGHVAGLVVSGRLIDRIGATRILPLMNAPFFAGLAGLAVIGHPAMLVVFLVLLGGASGLAQTSVAAMWAEVYGVERIGSIRSLAVMLMVMGTASGPAVIGAALDAGLGAGWIAGGLLAAGLAASALAFAGLAALPPANRPAGTGSDGLS